MNANECPFHELDPSATVEVVFPDGRRLPYDAATACSDWHAARGSLMASGAVGCLLAEDRAALLRIGKAAANLGLALARGARA